MNERREQSGPPEEATRVLDEWFGPTRDPEVWPEAEAARWWTKDPAYDASLRARFGELLTRARRGALDGWTGTDEGGVALVVLLDQFSRNIHRDRPEAFAADDQALALAEALAARASLSALPEYMQVFVGLPFMHAESSRAQRRGQAYFRALAARARPAFAERLASNVDFMDRHAEIIFRFGRFPHRNAILGRPSTPGERSFLAQPGSSF